jgi:hypothetical protein
MIRVRCKTVVLTWSMTSLVARWRPRALIIERNKPKVIWERPEIHRHLGGGNRGRDEYARQRKGYRAHLKTNRTQLDESPRRFMSLLLA